MHTVPPPPPLSSESYAMQLTFAQFFFGQLLGGVPPVLEKDLEGKTIIVTGANVGIGYETVKHFAKMNAGKIILACRDQKRGDAAVEKVKQETGHKNIELWLLDLANFESVKSFADRYEKEGGRLDILVQNAAVIPNFDGKLHLTNDGWETTFQVNHLATSLLSLLLLPRMLETAEKYRTTPRMVIVASEVHYFTQLKTEDVLNENNKYFDLFAKSEEYYTPIVENRYQDSKLLNVFFTRALSARLAGKKIIVNCVNPGYCLSNLRSQFAGVRAVIDWLMERFIARTAEQGSRQLVWAALAEPEESNEDLRGAFVSLAKVNEPSDYVISEDGQKVENKLWDLTIDELAKLDSRVSGILKSSLTF